VSSRTVRVYEIDRGKRVCVGNGKFHAWGTNWDSFPDGRIVTFSTALVEIPTGAVLNLSVELIEFINPSKP